MCVPNSTSQRKKIHSVKSSVVLEVTETLNWNWLGVEKKVKLSKKKQVEILFFREIHSSVQKTAWEELECSLNWTPILSKNSICLWPIHIDIHVLKLNPKEIKEHLKRINQLHLNDSRKRNLFKRKCWI